MDKTIPVLLIGLFLGGGIGFTWAAANGVTLAGHDHGDGGHHVSGHQGHGHAHDTPLDLPSGPDAPALEISLEPDQSAGWNLHIASPGFRFSPENVNGPHIPGEGHAHLYVNGAKHSRIYGTWVHLAELPAGEVTVSVTLNANDHSPLSVGGELLSATTVVDN